MTNSNKIERRPRTHGICAAAKTLGVTRQHLYEVLRGRRISRPLMAAYNNLKIQEKRTA